MPFPEREAMQLMARCHRRCCICHRFCGFKMELDHITPKAEGGSDAIDNAIPVCFECHAEIHAYNDRHPRGRKYRPDELRVQKDQWLRLCESSAQFLASVPPHTDVRPIQALIDELEFNRAVAASAPEVTSLYCSAHFSVARFSRSMAEGVLSLLEPSLKRDIIAAYAVIERANTAVDAIAHARAAGGEALAVTVNDARSRIADAQPLIERALGHLEKLLASTA